MKLFKMIGIVIVISIFTIGLIGCSQEKAPADNNHSEREIAVKEKEIKRVKENKTNAEAVKVEKEEEIKSSITLSAVGDILIHNTVYQDAKTTNGYDFNGMFELVKPYMENSDITFANQETMIGGEEVGLSSYPSFNSPQEVGDTLKDIGVDIVSVANNHTLDRGERAIQSALAYWDKIGIPYTGSYKNEEDSTQIRVIEKNGVKVAFLAYTYGTNGIPVKKPYLVNLIDAEKMKKDIEEAKKISDVVAVSMHWGVEYQMLPNEEQKGLAQFLANQKVDIVIGTHPHVLEPYDWVDSEDGTSKTFVVYSLGNFISGQDKLYRQLGGMMNVEVEKTTKGDETKVEVKNPKFLPTYVYYHNWRNYKIYPLKDVPTNLLPNRDKLYNEITNHMKQWVPETQIIQ